METEPPVMVPTLVFVLVTATGTCRCLWPQGIPGRVVGQRPGGKYDQVYGQSRRGGCRGRAQRAAAKVSQARRVKARRGSPIAVTRSLGS